MKQKIKKERITKAEWYNRGGFANSALFRLQSRGGAWRYYVKLDRMEEKAITGCRTGRWVSEPNVQYIKPPEISPEVAETIAAVMEAAAKAIGWPLSEDKQ